MEIIHMNKAKALLLFILLAMSGCAMYSDLKYESWHGPSEYQGRGGTKQISNGIEIWQNGEPPEKFKVIGVILQDYKNDALNLVKNYSDEELYKKAAEVGGDGLILVESNRRVDGYYSQINNYGYQPTVTTSQSSSSVKKYIVFKYIK